MPRSTIHPGKACTVAEHWPLLFCATMVVFHRLPARYVGLVSKRVRPADRIGFICCSPFFSPFFFLCHTPAVKYDFSAYATAKTVAWRRLQVDGMKNDFVTISGTSDRFAVARNAFHGQCVNRISYKCSARFAANTERRSSRVFILLSLPLINSVRRVSWRGSPGVFSVRTSRFRDRDVYGEAGPRYKSGSKSESVFDPKIRARSPLPPKDVMMCDAKDKKINSPDFAVSQTRRIRFMEYFHDSPKAAFLKLLFAGP